jgi:Eukaryotic cytochrome b561
MTSGKKDMSAATGSNRSFLVFLCRFLAVSSLILVGLNSFAYGTLFALHPISMMAAFVWLISEGILVAKMKFKTVAERQQHLDSHGTLQFGTLLLGSLGFGSAFATKIQFGKDHF